MNDIKRWISCLPVFLLAACGGSGSSSPSANTSSVSSSSSASSTSAPGVAKFLYIPSIDDSTITAYRINKNTGDLTAVSGSPFPTDKFPVALTLDPTGQFFYVSNMGDGTTPPTISGFRVNANTGALEATPNSPYWAGTGVNAAVFSWLLFHPFLNLALSENATDGQVYGYHTNPVTGELIPILPSTIAIPQSFPSGRFSTEGFYYTASSGGNIDVYEFDSATGIATKSSTTSNSKPGGIVVLDPSGEHLYSFNPASADISVYDVSKTTGALSEINGSPFFLGSSSRPVAGFFVNSGRFLYVIDPSVDPFSPGQPPVGASNKVRSFFDAAGNGAISETGEPLDFGDNSLLSGDVIPNGKFFVATTAGGIFVAAINSMTGALTQVSGSPFATTLLDSGTGTALLDPSGKYLYVTNFIAQTVQVFSVNEMTGNVTALNSYPVGNNPAFPLVVGQQ